MIRKHVFLALVLLLFTISPAAAQFRTDGSATYISMGFATSDVDELSDALGAAGYDELDGGALSLGTAQYRFLRGFALGLEGHATRGDEGSGPAGSGYRTQLLGRYAVANVGYLVRDTERLRVYPYVGLGYGDLRLRVRSEQDAAFGEVLLAPERGSLLRSRSWLANVGVGTDLLIALHENEDEVMGVSLGLRAGYLASLGAGDWTLFEENDVADAPDATLSGFYVRLLIGRGKSDR